MPGFDRDLTSDQKTPKTGMRTSIPDSAIMLQGLTAHRADRAAASLKTKGGGLCVFVNDRWCTRSTVVEHGCSPDVEFMVVRCRPYYLPREFTVVIVVAVYIPPQSDAKLALTTLANAISKQQSRHPDAALIIVGDFNQTDLRTVLSKFHQPVSCPTRGGNTLDHVYTNIKEAFSTTPCLRSQIRTLPNQKPWMNSDVRSLLKARDAAFKSGNSEELKAARHNLKAGIRAAKHKYSSQIAAHFNTNSDPRRMWQGIQVITDYKSKVSTPVTTDAALPAELNNFYARFKTSAQAQSPNAALFHTTEEEPPLILAADEVRTALMRVGIPGRVLKACASRLASTFTDIFNLSLAQSTVPVCFKTTSIIPIPNPSSQSQIHHPNPNSIIPIPTPSSQSQLHHPNPKSIIPVPKKSIIASMNDYRPIALTPIVMKCSERLTLSHIKRSLPSTLDPHQFAYRANRSTDDASPWQSTPHSTTWTAPTHILLSNVFSLENKLDCIRLQRTTRRQSRDCCVFVFTEKWLSDRVPDAAIQLDGLASFRADRDSNGNIILKFADDTAVIGRITGGDEAAYRKEVDSLVAWCTKNNLTLNTDKTKEMIVDMRKERRPHQPLFIRDLEVERVSSFKYLGVHISDDLTWTLNTTYVLKRAQQRLYFLRRLRKFGMSPRILSNFYSCIIESILTSCITVWYGSTTVKDRKRLQRVVKTATKITKMAQPSLQSIYNLRVHRRAASIIKDPTHPQQGLFTLLPSGTLYWSLATARL
ncbi:hypothetical protein NFI96_008190 [Prochilodus magdalenae]|nr:hypothetical protein NFI96_008190 [Prochilodus magdalenae]